MGASIRNRSAVAVLKLVTESRSGWISRATWSGYNFRVMAFRKGLPYLFPTRNLSGRVRRHGEQKGSFQEARCEVVFASIELTGFGVVGRLDHESLTGKAGQDIWPAIPSVRPPLR